MLIPPTTISFSFKNLALHRWTIMVPTRLIVLYLVIVFEPDWNYPTNSAEIFSHFSHIDPFTLKKHILLITFNQY